MFLVSTSLSAQKELSLPLPDGSFVRIREGETAKAAWIRAQNMYPEAFGFKKIDDANKMDIDWFNDCRTRISKEAKTDAALGQMLASCRHQAVPQKCRGFQVKFDAIGNEVGDERVRCVEECSLANFYSKNLGECKKG